MRFGPVSLRKHMFPSLTVTVHSYNESSQEDSSHGTLCSTLLYLLNQVSVYSLVIVKVKTECEIIPEIPMSYPNMRPPKAAMMLQITTCPVSFAGKSWPRLPPDSTAAIAGMSSVVSPEQNTNDHSLRNIAMGQTPTS